ncbi:nucleolin 2-like [Triticum urartu]|uniref:nucleolin 2-like n=1 Tax=Triticum urartu TaxID=4572 RepID=UPI002043687C|nr:nucleolin 2-like [Triticum urartu]
MELLAGLNHFDEILEEADGIILSRGNFGIDLPPEKKSALHKCNMAGKPAVVTHVVDSMTDNLRILRVATAQKKNQELDGSDSDSDYSSDEDKATKKPVAKKVVESSESSDSDSEEDTTAKPVKKNKESSDSSDSDSDSDSEEDTSAKTVSVKKEESSGSSDNDSDSDSDEPAKSTIPAKRLLTTEKKSEHSKDDSDDSSDESDEEPALKKPKEFLVFAFSSEDFGL